MDNVNCSVVFVLFSTSAHEYMQLDILGNLTMDNFTDGNISSRKNTANQRHLSTLSPVSWISKQNCFVMRSIVLYQITL